MRRVVLTLFFLAFPLLVSAQNFGRNLYFGLNGDSDVVRLQDFLRSQGYFDYPTSTGNYGPATLGAVKKFQKANSIPPLGGYFGPQSRAAANRIFGNIPPVSVPVSGPQLLASATTSPFKGKIFFGYVSGYGSSPDNETITVENRSEKNRINITGFIIESSRGGRLVVPKGQELAVLPGANQDDIILKPGGRATVVPGRQDLRINFQENLCTGYLDQNTAFTPGLSHQCPRIDTRDLLSLSDRCLNIVDSTSSCRKPILTSWVDSNCSQFLNDHLSYAGCVRDNSAEKDFYTGKWLIWMQGREKFLRNTRELVILKDQQNREVDRYSY